MNRRNFIQAGSAAAALSIVNPVSLLAQTTVAGTISPAVIKSIRNRIKPITAEERAQRRTQARKLMAENNMDAIFMEGGTSLNYFAGARWGRSERLFGMLLPKSGEPVFISPKFEESRAKEQTGNAELYCWEEYESPFELLAKILKDHQLSSAAIGVEETTRYFVTEGIQKAIPAARLGSATPITAGCRAVKSDHEIELMQIANDIAREVYLAAVRQLKEHMSEAEFGSLITKLFAEFGVEGGALVLFGEASAHPHGLVKEVRLKQGDIVLIDGGCSVERL